MDSQVQQQSAIYPILWGCISSWYYGYHLSELNFPATSLTCISRSHPPESRIPLCLDITTERYGFVTAIYTVGGLVGSLGSSWLINRYGITKGITFTAYINLLGTTTMTLSTTWERLAFGRFVVGVSSGVAICLVPPFLAQTARSSPQLSQRAGQVGTLHQMAIVIGLFTAQIAGLIFTGSKGDIPGNWRYVTAVSGIVSLVQIFTAVSIVSPFGERRPPSRRPSAVEGLSPVPEADESASSLLSGENRDTDTSKETQMTLREVLSNTAFRGPTLVCATLMGLQQLSGVNAVMFYSTPVLKPLLPTGAGVIGIGITLINVLMTVVAMGLVDRVQRRSLLLFSALSMAAMSALLAFGLNGQHNTISAVAIIMFIVAYSIGLGPVPFLLISELVPAPGIPVLSSLSLSLSWVSAFFIAIAFLPLRDALSSPVDPRDPLSNRKGEGRIFYVFTVMCILAALVSWRGTGRRAGVTSA